MSRLGWLVVVATLGACGDGQNELVAIAPEAAGSHCPEGGQVIETGIDLDGNGVLDPSEVTATQYVCNGANGSDGTNGMNGSDGTVPLATVDGDVTVHTTLDAALLDGVGRITGTLTIDTPDVTDLVIRDVEHVDGGIAFGAVPPRLALAHLVAIDHLTVPLTEEVVLPALTTVTGTLAVDAPTFLAPALTSVGDLELQDLVGAVAFPLLATAPKIGVDGTSVSLTLGALHAVDSLNTYQVDVHAPVLDQAGTIEMIYPVEFEMPQLSTVTVSLSINGGTPTQFSFAHLSSVDSLSFGNVVTSGSIPAQAIRILEITGSGTSIAFPSLATADSIVYGGTQLTSISLPQLTSLNSLYVENNDGLVNLDFPALTSIVHTLEVVQNPMLSVCILNALAARTSPQQYDQAGNLAATCP